MSELINPSQPHRTILAASPATNSQQQLSDYEAKWPTIAHDPEIDLSEPAMDDRTIDKKSTAIREGTILTLNTVLQGKVTETNLEQKTVIPHFDSDLRYYDTTTARLTPIHPAITDDILVVLQGGYSKRQAYIPLGAESDAPIEIRDLRVHNEHNLEDDINIDLYETLKLYHGGTAIRLKSKETKLGRKITIGTVNEIADGTLVYDNEHKQSSTELRISPDAISDDWFFLPEHTAATQLRQLHPPDDTQTATLDADLSDAQKHALTTVRKLPPGTYTATPQGIYRTGEINGSVKGVKILTGDTARDAFALSPDDSTTDTISPISGSDLSPTDPITDITGIGTVTGEELSGIASLPSTSTSRASPTDRFTPLPENPNLETENWTENDELCTVAANDIPPEITGQADDTANLLDYVRKLPDDEIPQALIDAKETYTPPETAPENHTLNAIKEFVADGTPVYKASKQYFLRAVADLRAYFKAHHNQTHNESIDSTLLRLHAGATVGRLLGPDGTEEGKLPNLLFNNLSIDEIAGVEAWTPKANPLPQLRPRHPPRYLLYREAAPAFPDGPLELGDAPDPWTHPGTELDVTQADRLGETVTFHQGAPPDADNLPHVTIHETVAEYIATLAGATLTDSTFLENHVTMTTEDDLFIDIPETGLAFAVLQYQ